MGQLYLLSGPDPMDREGRTHDFRRPSANAMNCHDAREGFAEYLEASLPASRRQGIDAHLSACAECASVLGELTRAIELTSDLTSERMPIEMKRALLKAFREQKQSGA